MTVYQHKKGKIRDNAIEALLHDPLFKPRIEVNQKGKGSYRRKDKHAGKGFREASGKQQLTTGFLVMVGCSALLTNREFQSAALPAPEF